MNFCLNKVVCISAAEDEAHVKLQVLIIKTRTSADTYLWIRRTNVETFKCGWAKTIQEFMRHTYKLFQVAPSSLCYISLVCVIFLSERNPGTEQSYVVSEKTTLCLLTAAGIVILVYSCSLEVAAYP